jgi:hypothetical protein
MSISPTARDRNRTQVDDQGRRHPRRHDVTPDRKGRRRQDDAAADPRPDGRRQDRRHHPRRDDGLVTAVDAAFTGDRLRRRPRRPAAGQAPAPRPYREPGYAFGQQALAPAVHVPGAEPARRPRGNLLLHRLPGHPHHLPRLEPLPAGTGRRGCAACWRTIPQRWTIVTQHHPIFSPANGRDNPELRAAWKPVFDEFKVDLVLTGHDHTYARSGDVAGRGGSKNMPSGYNQAYDPAIGTVYVVSVSGPKMYNVSTEASPSGRPRTRSCTRSSRSVPTSCTTRRAPPPASSTTLRAEEARPRPANALIESLPPQNRRRPAAPAPTKAAGQ